MIYKLLHKVFGWDYIYWSNTADHGIARVFKLDDGTVAYWRYKNTKLLDEVVVPEDVIWLTCRHNKYFLDSEGGL